MKKIAILLIVLTSLMFVGCGSSGSKSALKEFEISLDKVEIANDGLDEVNITVNAINRDGEEYDGKIDIYINDKKTNSKNFTVNNPGDYYVKAVIEEEGIETKEVLLKSYPEVVVQQIKNLEGNKLVEAGFIITYYEKEKIFLEVLSTYNESESKYETIAYINYEYDEKNRINKVYTSLDKYNTFVIFIDVYEYSDDKSLELKKIKKYEKTGYNNPTSITEEATLSEITTFKYNSKGVVNYEHDEMEEIVYKNYKFDKRGYLLNKEMFMEKLHVGNMSYSYNTRNLIDSIEVKAVNGTIFKRYDYMYTDINGSNLLYWNKRDINGIIFNKKMYKEYIEKINSLKF